MPKDDWAKYARRDRGRKALATGQYFRTEKPKRPKKKAKPRKEKKPKQTESVGDFVIEYNGETPETSTIRYIKSGPIHLGLPPWPGFP